jgi:hypothetical protein
MTKTYTSKELLTGYYYVNSYITEENYPMQEKIDLTGAKVIRIGKFFSSQEALDRIKAEGCRPATIWELAAWKQENDKELKGKGEWYLAFGSTDFVADGCHGVPYVDADSVGDFGFGLGDFEYGWDDGYCLLCFCDNSTQALGTSEKRESLVPLNLESAIKICKDAGLVVYEVK